MEIKTEITISLPPMLAAALGITEDTLFETYFDGNCLRVRTLITHSIQRDNTLWKNAENCFPSQKRKRTDSPLYS